MGGIHAAFAGFARTPLSVSIAPDPATGAGSGGGSETVTSELATATPSGGLAPYTYAWTHVSGDAAITITSDTSQSTTFSKFMTPGASTSAVKRCTVTDAYGQTASDDVDVELTNI